MHLFLFFFLSFFPFDQINIMWSEKEDKWIIHVMILQTINLWYEVILCFGIKSVLLKKHISVFKNNTCCTRQNSAWQCCMCNLSCTLVAICSWRNSKFFKAVLDNSGTAVNIEYNFNWSNTEVSKLYHYALCTQERLGLLSTILKMRTAKILWYDIVSWCDLTSLCSIIQLHAFDCIHFSWYCSVIWWFCNLVPIHPSSWEALSWKAVSEDESLTPHMVSSDHMKYSVMIRA